MKEGTYWIAPDGTVYEVTEHISWMKEHAELFGLSPDDPRFLDPKGNRDELLTHALRQGWIRVRHNVRAGDHTNFWKLTAKTLDKIMGLYMELGKSYWDSITAFSELSTGKFWKDTVKGLVRSMAESRPVVIKMLCEKHGIDLDTLRA